MTHPHNVHSSSHLHLHSSCPSLAGICSQLPYTVQHKQALQWKVDSFPEEASECCAQVVLCRSREKQGQQEVFVGSTIPASVPNKVTTQKSRMDWARKRSWTKHYLLVNKIVNASKIFVHEFHWKFRTKHDFVKRKWHDSLVAERPRCPPPPQCMCVSPAWSCLTSCTACCMPLNSPSQRGPKRNSSVSWMTKHKREFRRRYKNFESKKLQGFVPWYSSCCWIHGRLICHGSERKPVRSRDCGRANGPEGLRLVFALRFSARNFVWFKKRTVKWQHAVVVHSEYRSVRWKKRAPTHLASRWCCSCPPVRWAHIEDAPLLQTSQSAAQWRATRGSRTRLRHTKSNWRRSLRRTNWTCSACAGRGTRNRDARWHQQQNMLLPKNMNAWQRENMDADEAFNHRVRDFFKKTKKTQ